MNVQTITGILILATLAESLVEYLVKPWLNRPDSDPRAAAFRDLGLRYIAAGIGMILTVLYQADLLAIVGLSSPWPLAGQLLTGLIIGRGANFVHDFASRWLSPTGASVR